MIIPNQKDPALVVLSGGQDSITCLGLALTHHPQVYAIGFDYGQRHAIELHSAQRVCDRFGISFKIIDLKFLSNLVTSALTGEGSVNENHERLQHLPASFVPNRNALFLTVAHAYAQEIKANAVYTGVCQTDYSGYPDCRKEFISKLQKALNTGYQTHISIVTPLMYLTKAETFALAEECNFLDVVLAYSHTCYEGDNTTKHDWGYGCGECPSCKLRAKGWCEYKSTVD